MLQNSFDDLKRMNKRQVRICNMFFTEFIYKLYIIYLLQLYMFLIHYMYNISHHISK